ncbi:MAG: hypothetical protein H6Q82_1297 [Deltaproteobacteria bacterium]|nr:hypothetical protein [Deltaproteobacteria bacterium]
MPPGLGADRFAEQVRHGAVSPPAPKDAAQVQRLPAEQAAAQRLQSEQNLLETGEMIPSFPANPGTSYITAADDPPMPSSRTPGRARILSRIPSVETYPSDEKQPMGIRSMNRTLIGISRAIVKKSSTSPRSRPCRSTTLIFTGESPARRAAAIPSRTFGRVSRRVISAYRSRRIVSRLMLMRERPASRNAAAISGSAVPLVVIPRSRTPGIPATRRTNGTIPRRTSGSPPVIRTFRTPRETATRTVRISSS